MSILSQIACIPCRKGEEPLSDEELAVLHPFVPVWEIVRDDTVRKLRNTFLFDEDQQRADFKERLSRVADKENHHPEIQERGSEVTVIWWTHAIRDLHPNDFIMAAKTEGVYRQAIVGHEGEMDTGEELPTLMEIPRFQQTFSRLRGGAPDASGRSG